MQPQLDPPSKNGLFIPVILPLYSDLPPLGSIMIKVHRENHGKKRREKQVLGSTEMGKVEIPALILESGQGSEKWSV